MKNKDLIKKYDEVYAAGEDKFWTFLPIEERLAVLGAVDWTGKTVLEIGCGTGDLAAFIAACGAKYVQGIDASAEAILSAVKKYDLKNLLFSETNIHNPDRNYYFDRYDVIVMVGVLEHLDDPWGDLGQILRYHTNFDSVTLLTCPSFINPRGYIWQALSILFDAPMSLTDKWVITPQQMIDWCGENGYECDVKSLDYDWGNKGRFIQDFKQRLPKVFPDIDPARIERLVAWLEDVSPYHTGGAFSGANMLYKITRVTG